ncbi:MAG: hypothetical protein COC01_09305 [Bacteroidetes bacterium]|nr:MAG: hypothetical protein COC01_09305 [Bacteroidota bacterium]
MGLEAKIAEITQTKTFKKFMGKLYGLGASVVIIGALFKLQHWPGAGPMLIIGLGTEAVIFFFSAFEPVHELTDWSLVYPELAHMDVEDLDKNKNNSKGKITEQLDDMLEEAKIGPELIESLGGGLRSLSDSASQLTDLSTAAIATNEYTENVKGASDSLSSMKEASDQGTEVMRGLAGASSDVKNNFNDIASASNQYSESMKGAVSGLDEMNSSYGKAVSALDEISASSTTTRSYNEQIEQITNNLASLNSMYELDLKDSNKKLMNTINELAATSEATKPFTEQMQTLTQSLGALNSSYTNEVEESNQRISTVREFYDGVSGLMENLRDSAEGAKRYKDEISQLGEKLAVLNNIYGNMLAVMNVNVEKPTE